MHPSLSSQCSRLFPQHPLAGDVHGLRVSAHGRYADTLNGLLGSLASAGIPLPAVSIDPEDGIVLWLVLRTPITVTEASTLLQAIKAQFLSDLPPDTHKLQPCPQEQCPLPPIELGEGRWSAFIDPSMLTMFRDETWLDLPPNPEQQASLLSRVESTTAAELRRALLPEGDDPTPCAPTCAEHAATPRTFLLAVMHDASLPMQDRIAAAAALLPYTERL